MGQYRLWNRSTPVLLLLLLSLGVCVAAAPPETEGGEELLEMSLEELMDVPGASK